MTPTNDAPVTVEQIVADAMMAEWLRCSSEHPSGFFYAMAKAALAALASAPAGDGELQQAAERVQRRVGEWDSLHGHEPRDRFAAFGENLRHDAMTLVTAALARPRAAVAIEVECIETVPLLHPFDDSETPPIWRIVIDGYCADFETEQAARNLAEAIDRLNGPRAAVETVDCNRCCGNGEIVADWDRYMHSHDGDKGDEAVADCPDCGGTGNVDSPRAAVGERE